MGESVTVTFRTGEEEEYFEALEDMAQDGYFDGNLSEGIRTALSAYMGEGSFPEDDFRIYYEARAVADKPEAREEILNQKFYARAVNEMIEEGDDEGLRELNSLYRKTKTWNAQSDQDDRR